MRIPGLSLAALWQFLAVALPVLGGTLAQMSTVDLAYQVRAGDLMLASGTVLRADQFTFTVAGEPWTNQQWGVGIILALAFGPIGWGGLAVLRAILVGLASGFVLAGARLSGAGPRAASVLALAGYTAGLPGLGLRAQLFGVVCFAAVLALLAARERHPRATWVIPVVVVAWANLHGSFFLGPAAVAVALLDALRGRRAGRRRLAVILVLSLAATVVSPFGVDTWSYVVAIGTDTTIAGLVTEWQRTSPFSDVGVLFYGSIAAAMAVGAAGWRRGWRPGWPTLVWLTGLAILGVWAVRGTVWWAVAAPIALAPAVAVLAHGRTAASSEIGRTMPPALRLANLLIAGLVGLAIVVLQPAWRPFDPLTGPRDLLTDAPGPIAVALAEAAGPTDRVFNAQRWGSWLEWAAPGIPLMVDSRIEVIPGTVWEEYLAISDGAPDWQERLDRLGATAVVAARKQQAGLLPLLDTAPGWRRLFADADGELFIRSP